MVYCYCCCLLVVWLLLLLLLFFVLDAHTQANKNRERQKESRKQIECYNAREKPSSGRATEKKEHEKQRHDNDEE